MNKILGAILGTLVFVMGIGFIAEAIYEPTEESGVGYALPEPEGGAVAGVQEEEPATPLPQLLANASAEDGEGVARKCQSCHTFEQGGANKTGPALYDIVGRPIAGHEGFSYSDALNQLASEDGQWTYDELSHFIEDPRGFAPGTKMTFTGISDEQDRADLLAYLQTLSEDPVPFPEPQAAETGGEGEQAAEDEGSGDAAADGETSGGESSSGDETASPDGSSSGEETSGSSDGTSTETQNTDDAQSAN